MAQIPPGGWKPARSNPAKCRYCFPRALRCSAARHHQPIRNLKIHIIAQLQFLPFLSERSSVGRFQAVRGACRFSVSATSAPPPASETLAEKTRKSRQPDDTDRPTDG